jgi:hypothetical protein
MQCDAVEHLDAENGEHAAHRHVGDQPEDDGHDHGFDTAGADAHQRPCRATRGENHAEAETEAADEMGQPGQAATAVDRLVDIDESRRVQRRRAQNRERNRQ